MLCLSPSQNRHFEFVGMGECYSVNFRKVQIAVASPPRKWHLEELPNSTHMLRLFTIKAVYVFYIFKAENNPLSNYYSGFTEEEGTVPQISQVSCPR